MEEINKIKRNLFSANFVNRLAINCNEEIKHLKEAIEDLFKNAFIEEFEPANRIHDLAKEFANIKVKMSQESAGFLSVEECISHLLPRYPVPPFQGESRMCQEVAVFFNKVDPNSKGIRIAGLYGMSGQGKTTLAKAFCNCSLRDFNRKVCYLEFCEGNKLERLKLVLQYLTKLPMPHIESVTNDEEARYLFSTLVKGQRVLLVLDDITEQNIEEVEYYLGVDFGKDSCILLIGRRVLLKSLKPCASQKLKTMCVPKLKTDEAMAILYERKPLVSSGFPAEDYAFAEDCINQCFFEEDYVYALHPLALKVFGRHLFREQSRYLPLAKKYRDNVFVVNSLGICIR